MPSPTDRSTPAARDRALAIRRRLVVSTAAVSTAAVGVFIASHAAAGAGATATASPAASSGDSTSSASPSATSDPSSTGDSTLQMPSTSLSQGDAGSAQAVSGGSGR